MYFINVFYLCRPGWHESGTTSLLLYTNKLFSYMIDGAIIARSFVVIFLFCYYLLCEWIVARLEQIFGGYEHTFALTSDGDVLAFGNGVKGQLGIGNTGTDCTVLDLICLLSSRAKVWGLFLHLAPFLLLELVPYSLLNENIGVVLWGGSYCTWIHLLFLSTTMENRNRATIWWFDYSIGSWLLSVVLVI